LQPSGLRFSPANPTQLQKALDVAQCGQTVQLEAGTTISFRGEQVRIRQRCPAGQELVISTSHPEYLPDAESRITPAYRPLIPLIVIEDAHPDHPPFQLDSTQPPVSGIKFVGLGLESRVRGGREPYTLFQIGSVDAASRDQLPTNVTFDRVYFTGDLQPSKRLVMAMWVVGGGMTVENSFFDDFHRGPNEEGYVVYIANEAPGPFVFRNNYFGSGAAIPILVGGGSGPAFTAGQPHPTGFLVEHNHFYNSLKFYPGTPGYVGDANYPCIKNFFELKQGSDAVIRWNSGENSFNGCAGQGFGFVFTPRNIATKQGGVASISSDRRTVRIAAYQSRNGLRPPQAGYVLGVGRIRSIPDNPRPGHFEWRTIRNCKRDGSSLEITVDEPFSAEALPEAEWALATIPWGRIFNIRVEGNLLRNTATSMLTLGTDGLYPSPGLRGLVYRNNLTVNDSPYFRLVEGRQSWIQGFVKLTLGGEDILIEHNTMVVLPTIHADGKLPRYNLTQEQGERELGFITRGLRFRANVVPWGQWGIVASGLNPTQLWNEGNDGGLVFEKNVMYQMPVGPEWKKHLENCQKPRVCRENIFAPEQEVTDRNFELLRYRKLPGELAPGVDPDQVPRIRLEVRPQPAALSFQYQLPAVLGNRSCSLEVSPDRGLISDTTSYHVVAALQPDKQTHADSDRHNPRAHSTNGGRTRTFLVDGLEANRAYYYRLMCGGGVERGTAQTAAQ
jgi:hypothetical protein